MNDDINADGDAPEPAQTLLYHATGKLYRYLAGFAGEDPDEVEEAYRESFGEVTAGADPVLIGDAIGDGIALGISLAERRRALRQYHDDLVRRKIAPAAFDTEPTMNGAGDVIGLRVLVSEPECQFFTSAMDDPRLLARTPAGGEVGIPLAFEPGAVEPVESGATVSEIIVRPIDWSSPESADGAPETTREHAASVDTESEPDDSLKNRADEVTDAKNDDGPPETEGGAEE